MHSQVASSFVSWLSKSREIGRKRGAVRGCIRRFAGRRVGLAFSRWLGALAATSAQLERVGHGLVVLQGLVRRRDHRRLGRAWRELLTWLSDRRFIEAMASSKDALRARCCAAVLRSFGRRRLVQSFKAWSLVFAESKKLAVEKQRGADTIVRLGYASVVS